MTAIAQQTLAPPLAHLGHWYISLPLFMGPVLALAIALKLQTWRERHRGPDRTGKHSTVTTTHDHDRGKATITVTGPLDYPALLELDIKLGEIAREAPEIVLDLRRVTTADEQAAWSLCEAIGRRRAHSHISAIVKPEPATQSLRTICATEEVELIEQRQSGTTGRRYHPENPTLPT
jgi:ABC-type transporter Mla MlaB component